MVRDDGVRLSLKNMKVQKWTFFTQRDPSALLPLFEDSPNYLPMFNIGAYCNLLESCIQNTFSMLDDQNLMTQISGTMVGLLMSIVLGVPRGARLSTKGYRKQIIWRLVNSAFQ